jgi:hypothetical protein
MRVEVHMNANPNPYTWTALYAGGVRLREDTVKSPTRLPVSGLTLVDFRGVDDWLDVLVPITKAAEQVVFSMTREQDASGPSAGISRTVAVKMGVVYADGSRDILWVFPTGYVVVGDVSYEEILRTV